VSPSGKASLCNARSWSLSWARVLLGDRLEIASENREPCRLSWATGSEMLKAEPNGALFKGVLREARQAVDLI